MQLADREVNVRDSCQNLHNVRQELEVLPVRCRDDIAKDDVVRAQWEHQHAPRQLLKNFLKIEQTRDIKVLKDFHTT